MTFTVAEQLELPIWFQSRPSGSNALACWHAILRQQRKRTKWACGVPRSRSHGKPKISIIIHRSSHALVLSLKYENVKEEQKGPALIILRWSFNITKASRRQRVRWLFISPDENASHLCGRNKDANKKERVLSGVWILPRRYVEIVMIWAWENKREEPHVPIAGQKNITKYQQQYSAAVCNILSFSLLFIISFSFCFRLSPLLFRSSLPFSRRKLIRRGGVVAVARRSKRRHTVCVCVCPSALGRKWGSCAPQVIEQPP
jgi:hypothetical protein